MKLKFIYIYLVRPGALIFYTVYVILQLTWLMLLEVFLRKNVIIWEAFKDARPIKMVLIVCYAKRLFSA